jgi:hypothetical protein
VVRWQLLAEQASRYRTIKRLMDQAGYWLYSIIDRSKHKMFMSLQCSQHPYKTWQGGTEYSLRAHYCAVLHLYHNHGIFTRIFMFTFSTYHVRVPTSAACSQHLTLQLSFISIPCM